MSSAMVMIVAVIVANKIVGEIAAAFAGGLLSLRDTIVIAYYRGSCSTKTGLGKPGAMCAVGLNEALAERIIQKSAGSVQLAAVNSPTSCTLSGDRGHIEQIVQSCKKEGIFAQILRVDLGKRGRC